MRKLYANTKLVKDFRTNVDDGRSQKEQCIVKEVINLEMGKFLLDSHQHIPILQQQILFL